MILPKPDELHFMICIGLDPPLRQGQTRYPFLVMQFKKDEEVTIDLNMTEELLKEKYEGKLLPHYEQPLHQVVTQVFRGLAGKKVNQPAKDFVRYGIPSPSNIVILTFTATTNNLASSALSKLLKASFTALRRLSCLSLNPPPTSPTSKHPLSHSPASGAPSPQAAHSTSLSI